VGYTLTALIVQLGVVRKLAENREALERLEQLEKLVRLSLQDVRREVSNLRNNSDGYSSMSWKHRWSQLCDLFADCTGVRVAKNIHGNLDSLDGDFGENIYRIIQEGLTNSYRHGRATVIDVSMMWKESKELILLRISDNGVGCDDFKPGNGLSGIRERVETMKGNIVFSTGRNRGFDLGIDIPWTGERENGKDTRAYS